MAEWSFLTNHARVLVCIAHDPGVRLREIATTLGIRERSAYGIVTDLTAAGYIVKKKDGRRNRYQVQAHLPIPAGVGRVRRIGEVSIFSWTRPCAGASERDERPATIRGCGTLPRDIRKDILEIVCHLVDRD